jgi:hypothetical protein
LAVLTAAENEDALGTLLEKATDPFCEEFGEKRQRKPRVLARIDSIGEVAGPCLFHSGNSQRQYRPTSHDQKKSGEGSSEQG